MHVHIGALNFLIAACYMVIFGFFWRVISVRYSDTSVGQAMAWIY